MDNLTHSLVGAVLGQAGLKTKTGLAMPALIIGANLPDVDAACFFWLEGVEHLGFRRGITHGPPAMVLLPLVLAGLLWGYDRWQDKRGKRPEGRLPVNFKWLFLLSFIACLSHPALDWLNVYGIRLLEPFSSQWFYGDSLFIIDVWLWALLLVSLIWSFRREKRGLSWTRPARISAALGLAYIGLNGAITGHAEHQGKQLAESYYGLEGMTVVGSPVPFYFWERELLFRYEATPEEGGGAAYDTGTFRLAEGPVIIEDNGQYGSERITLATPTEEPQWDRLAFHSEWEEDRARKAAERSSKASAFLFWSRMPIIRVDQTEDGRLIFDLYDQRFRDPRAVDRFSVSYLEDGKPVEPPH